MEKEKTRILNIIDELGPGGAERRLVQLLTRLTESPDHFDVDRGNSATCRSADE